MANVLSKVLNKAKKGIDKTFIEPSRRLRKEKQYQDTMNKGRLESGEFRK